MMDDRGLEMSVFTAEQLCLYPINVASSNPYVRQNSIDIVKKYLEDTKVFAENEYRGSITLEINNQMYFDNPDKAVQRASRWLDRNPYVNK